MAKPTEPRPFLCPTFWRDLARHERQQRTADMVKAGERRVPLPLHRRIRRQIGEALLRIGHRLTDDQGGVFELRGDMRGEGEKHHLLRHELSLKNGERRIKLDYVPQFISGWMHWTGSEWIEKPHATTAR